MRRAGFRSIGRALLRLMPLEHGGSVSPYIFFPSLSLPLPLRALVFTVPRISIFSPRPFSRRQCFSLGEPGFIRRASPTTVPQRGALCCFVHFGRFFVSFLLGGSRQQSSSAGGGVRELCESGRVVICRPAARSSSRNERRTQRAMFLSLSSHVCAREYIYIYI